VRVLSQKLEGVSAATIVRWYTQQERSDLLGVWQGLQKGE